jgi:hypothetical protein
MRGLGLATALAVLGAAGCSEYRYFDVTVKLDPVTLGNGVVGGIQRCHATVLNAKGDFVDEFDISDPRNPSSLACPLGPNRTEGTFEYSTLSSGDLTFKVSVYDNANTTPACEIGNGQVTIPSKETTNAADLTVMGNGSDGCT